MKKLPEERDDELPDLIPELPAIEEFTPIQKLTKDLKAAAIVLGRDEARFLVDNYYMMQKNRVKYEAQIRNIDASGEPHEVIDWLYKESKTLERNIQRALDIYSNSQAIGARMRKVYGIGPVIAAGLLAHIDMDIATHPGKILRYAGLDPTIVWNKGEKRPFNANLKVLCWKIGVSFMKGSGSPKCTYGHFYKQVKQELIEKNKKGLFAEAAAEKLEKFKIGKTTIAYKSYSIGKLPDGHIDARARRKTLHLFISHFHTNWLEELGRPAVRPWIIEHGGHVDYIPPDW